MNNSTISPEEWFMRRTTQKKSGDSYLEAIDGRTIARQSPAKYLKGDNRPVSIGGLRYKFFFITVIFIH